MIYTGIPGPEWDEIMSELGGHFYQTRVWAEFQAAQGREVLRAHGDDWAWMGALRNGRGGVKYLYCSYGPVVQGSWEPVLASLREAGVSQGVDFVRIEPLGNVSISMLKDSGLKLFEPVQPQHVLELDITPSEDELRKHVSQSNRNLINQAEARGLSFRISEEDSAIKDFNRIHNATAKAGGFVNHPDDYYGTLVNTIIQAGVGRLYFVDHAGEAIAAALCYDWNGTRYYAYAGADPVKNRELKAAIALVWWLIADAKKHGLARFNYGGVAPEGDENHPWAGHSRFKRSIGGETLKTVGTWDLPLKKTKYALYRAIKKVAK